MIQVPSRTITIGGELTVSRIGFGAMQLTGPGVWGPPADIPSAMGVLRGAVELGVNFIDTADVYGPGDNERLIREALRPRSSGVVVATKGGLVRSGPATKENPGFRVDGSERHIRQAVDRSLEDLGAECIDLYQLHRVDPSIPVEVTMKTFRALRDEGKIRHIGLSEASVEDIERARSVVEIASVQNVYNVATRMHEAVLKYCEAHGIVFIPFWPLHSGDLVRSRKIENVARERNATPAQVALAWLLNRSPSTLLIPGTSSIAHLQENVAAYDVRLTQSEMDVLDHL